MTPKMRALLDVFARSPDETLTPNVAGSLMDPQHRPRRRLNRAGRYTGYGSLVSFTLQALHRRGLIEWGPRPDGLTGTAYRITEEGLDAASD